jgi:CRISPR-associated protein (TIGR02584 family)
MQSPHTFKRRILLCVIGKTPQIVTETLYKLAVEQKPVFIPTEIHLITTSEGARSAQHALLGVGGEKGEFAKFCRDYSMHSIVFSQQNIHIISASNGDFIDDAQGSRHNRITADFITHTVHQFTTDNNCAIHLSLAGGRKTMSYYAGYALSLYGRMQDRLSHVLVARPFQENQDFFYPPPQPRRIAIGNTYYSTDEANIILADIPFVRMRCRIPQALLDGQMGFQDTVQTIQRFAEPEIIEISITEKRVSLNTLTIPMDDADLAVYLWMCQRRISNEPPFVPDADAFVEDYIRVYAQVVGKWSGMINRVEKIARQRTALQQKKWFQQRISKLKKSITNILGERSARPFLIQTVSLDGVAAYTISLDSNAIRITA